MIEKGTRAGEPIILEDIIRANSELQVELELYAGRSYFDLHLKKLQSAVLKFPAGVEREAGISLKVEYTDKGILNFDTWLTKNKNVKVQVTLDKSTLSEKELKEKRKKIGLNSIKEVF